MTRHKRPVPIVDIVIAAGVWTTVVLQILILLALASGK